MTRKHILPAEGTAQAIYYETSEDNTAVKFYAGGQYVTSHSKSDEFGRKVFDELQLGTGFVSRQFSYHTGEVTEEHIENKKLKSSPTTQLVSSIALSDGRTLSYEYDEEERITKVTETFQGENVSVTEYTYDSLGQLLAETVNGEVVNTMTYDNYGNIVSKNGVVYTYGDEHWKDLLTGYGDKTITYDTQGNPLNYLGNALTWEKGRQLKKLVKADGTVIDYTYNANGIRTSKTVNGVKHTYTLDGTKIFRETWTKDGVNHSIVPMYDNEDSVCGIQYNGEPFYFQKNLQGDIIEIVDKDANTVARYSYDAWGVCTVTEDVSGCNVAEVNPYRYRSYYFDAEIEMYYLQSRYYKPEIARFLNGDECVLAVTLTETVFGQNLFQYANNSPIKNIDTNGYYAMAAYYVPYSLATQMAALSAAGTSLLISLKSLLAMLWNIAVVVGLLLVAIAAVVYICNSITKIYNDIKSRVDAKGKNEYKNYKNKICVYVLTRKSNPLQSIFYVGRTKNITARYSKHSSRSSKYYKGEFYMFVIYICSSEAQSKVVEQAVLSACLVGEFTQIVFGQSPSNKIRGIAKNKADGVLKQLRREGVLDDTISLLGCTSENDLLYSMNQ